ncbi:MAG: TolB family protein [Candidatus Acidiferrales bacterium]
MKPRTGAGHPFFLKLWSKSRWWQAILLLLASIELGILLCHEYACVTAVTAAAPKNLAGKILFEHSPDGWPCWPTCDIYSVNADGTDLRALTKDGHSHDASWSWDGRQIVFIHDRFWPDGEATLHIHSDTSFNSHFAIELYAMDPDGRNSHLLRRVDGEILGTAWSPDGKHLALCYSPLPKMTEKRLKKEVPYGIYLLSANGQGRPRLLFPGVEMPAWNPNGRLLALAGTDPWSGEYAIGVGSVDGSHKVRFIGPVAATGIFGAWRLHVSAPAFPAWSPDGKQIAFSASFNSGGPSQEQIFVMRADGSQMRQVTGDEGWQCDDPSWAPDGTELAFSCHATTPSCAQFSAGILGAVLAPGIPRSPCVSRIFLLRMNQPNATPVQVTSFEGEKPQFDPVHVPLGRH